MNPHTHRRATDFKSAASADFAIRAWKSPLHTISYSISHPGLVWHARSEAVRWTISVHSVDGDSLPTQIIAPAITIYIGPSPPSDPILHHEQKTL